MNKTTRRRSDRKTRIAFILPYLAGGGAERVITNVIASLPRKQYQPMLILAVSGEDKLHGRVAADVTIVRIEARRLLSAVPAIIRVLWRERPEIVVSTLDHLNAVIGLSRPFWPIKSSYIMRLTDFGSLDSKRTTILLRLATKFAKKVVCQSDAMKDQFRSALHLPDHKMVVINNPVAIREIQAAATGPSPMMAGAGRRLVAAGRLVPAKGFDLLLNAMRWLPDDVGVTVLGDGSDKENLNEQAAELGLGSRVHFAGFIDDPYPYYRSADIFVLSSRREGFPNVILEAIACGTPVVATPVPGVAELVERYDAGVISNDFTDRNLAAAILRVLETPRRLPPSMLSQFDLSVVNKAWNELLKSVIA